MKVERYCLAQTQDDCIPEFVAKCAVYPHGFTISPTAKALRVSMFTYFALFFVCGGSAT